MSKRGSLVCVGVGMTLGSHLTPLCRSYIEQADVVFTGLSDGVMELWIAQMNPDVRSLQQYYREGKPRAETYREMVEAMLTEVRAGKTVCGAFYGHPGVFALPPRKALAIARSEGYEAHMEAGVSAEDTLYADLEIDPGEVGCQHFEANQVMVYRRRIDPSAYLVLWQIGIAGDRSYSKFSTGTEYRQLLVDLLLRDYNPDHEVILYTAATLPTRGPKIQRLKLKNLPRTPTDIHMTLVIPPGQALQPDATMRRKLAKLDAAQPAAGSPTTASMGTAKTPRTHLRLLEERDQALFSRLYCDPVTMRLIGPPLTAAAALRSFGKALSLTRSPTLKQRFYVIVENASGQGVGICGIQVSSLSARCVEVGTILPPGAQGLGYGKETVAAQLRIALEDMGMDRVCSKQSLDNAGAIGVLRSIGFHKLSSDNSEETWIFTRESLQARNSRGVTSRKTRRLDQQVGLHQ